MTAARLRLGIDFGTSTTIAMLQRPDARVQPLLFDGSPLLSSAVLLGPDGQLHTGRDAAHLARSAPERMEPNPKRRIDDTAVLLGAAEVGVRDLIVAVLGRVAREAARVAGPVQDVVLTHPANWGQNRRALLVDAARHAGFVNIELVGEPTAAATYFAHTRGAALPLGACVLVYDLGAGTCDVTLLRRTPTGFEQVASDGLNDVGGLDVDAAIIGFLQATYGQLWTDPATRSRLWDDVRSAKEMLSRASGTVVGIPALGREVPLGREQLEGLTRPVLRSTVSMTRALVNESGVGTAAIAGLFLVGGSSRIPLVATMLHEALGIAPVVAEQPELVVAEGSLYVNRTPNAAPVSAVPASGAPYPTTGEFTAPATPVSSPVFAAAPVSPAAATGQPLTPQRPFTPVMPPPLPAPAPRRRGPSPAVLIAMVLAGVLLVAGTATAYVYVFAKDRTGDPGPTGPTTPAATAGAQKAGGPGKYALEKLPEDECKASDATQYFDLYEGELAKPYASRSPNSVANSTSCQYSRVRALGDSKQQRTANISFLVYAYNDVSLAESQQATGEANAKLAGPNAPVTGLGEAAIAWETTGTGGTQDQGQLKLNVAMRDSNFRIDTYFVAIRGDGAAWSQQEKDDLRERTIAATKATFAKTVAAMAK
ncbi:Hsp70 family protein [Dactylosporangium sp. CS-033363]|uniref:Hsp70 family protein n=1 Tax=Dactylosporangium sp. CS-033363 TaxID=3239935 RepID=UPI003D8CAD8D